MKSRIINTKHLKFEEGGKKIIGHTSELKPSLFYYDKPEEARHDLYLQFMERENKMVKFKYSETTKGSAGVDHTDIFAPTDKFKNKYDWCADMKFYVIYDKANLFGDSNRPVHRKRDYFFKNKNAKKGAASR